ncbi:MAG TPA: sigma-70 family RNA polymerase sigma factor [Thermoanaerobaculia bacterium]|nr:sigma-70 family RNA polymerase sigma factor [Thermoanaerobaculia bacterium]
MKAGSESLEQPAADVFEQRAVDAVKGGDASAYDYLVSKYMKRVVSIAWGIVRNAHDAEDLAQEAFVKAYETMGRFKAGQPFGPWIYRIVTNLALDVVKHRKRFRHEELRDVAPAARRDEADLPSQSGELAARIDEAIESLPEMQRIVARLYLVEEFGHAEIAEMTNLSEGTVRSHLSLARGKLKEKLSDLYGDGHE